VQALDLVHLLVVQMLVLLRVCVCVCV